MLNIFYSLLLLCTATCLQATKNSLALSPSSESACPASQIAKNSLLDDAVDSLIRAIRTEEFCQVLDIVTNAPNKERLLQAATTYEITPLMVAAEGSHLAITEFLLESTCDTETLLNAQDTAGWTPLMYAVKSGGVATVRALVRAAKNKNAFICAQNNFKMTALMYAVCFRYPAMVKLLLEVVTNKHALLDMVDDQDNMAESLAMEYKYPEIIELLRTYRSPTA